MEHIAGRSISGNVLSTKREIAINAPVLPALTQACALPSLTRLIATRIDESFFSTQRAGGRFVHADGFACVLNRDTREKLGRRIAQFGFDRILETHEHYARVIAAAQEIEGRRNSYVGAVISAHAIDGDDDLHLCSSLAGST